MFTGKFFLAVIVITVAVTVIQWFFIGFLFHKHQASTPNTWRKESARSYAVSTLLTLFFSFMFLLVFALWKNNCDCSMDSISSILFGVVCWLAFSVTSEVGAAIYVNYSRMFVFGKCLSSLFEYAVAALLAGWIL